MNALLLDDVSFWDVIWWMFIMYFIVLVIWMFIRIFGDIFRRHDLSGFGKAAWIIAIFIVPFLGAILYICFRPRVTPTDGEMMAAEKQASRSSATDEIAQAQTLLSNGAITQAEFDTIKSRALA